MTTDATAVVWPELPSFAVERPALLDRLEQALDRRVVLLVAPAGYGKSVLLAQWARARPDRRVAWASARGVGRDALRFGRRLRKALVAADPGLATRLGRMSVGVDRLGPVFLDHVVDELERGPEMVLVIEDFEELSSPGVLEDLGQLADRLPTTARLILASRRDPDIGLHRLRLRDEVAEIRQDDLAMSDDHVCQLVRALAECELRSDQARALVARTEGWPAGVQLAALSLRHRADVDTYLEQFSGDDRHVADYLSDEILDGLAFHEREFLLATSIVDRLNAPLCDALTGRGDSQRMLESLYQRSLFLSALDNRRSSYQYHPLFRDLLRYELRTERPDDEVRLHRVAAQWFLAAKEPKAAAEHLLAARDWEGVVALADREGRSRFERGDSHIVLGWLERLPRDLVDRDPEIALATVVMRITSGRALAAEDLIDRTTRTHDLPPALELVVDVARLSLVYHHGSPTSALGTAAHLLELLPEVADELGAGPFGMFDPESLRLQGLGGAARAELLLGNVGAAREWIAPAVGLNAFPVLSVHVLGTAAYCDALSGRLGQAADRATRALLVAEELMFPQHSACADAHLALAHVATQRGELAEAERHLADALAAAQSNRRHLLVSVQRAEWGEWLAASGRPDALALVTADPALGEPPRPPGVRARMAATRARLLLAVGRGEGAAALLDDYAGPWTSDLAAARASVAAAAGDNGGIRKVVDGWSYVDADEPWSRLQRGLWEAVLLNADDRRTEAEAALDEVLALAEPDGHVQVFRDGGRDVARLLRRRYLSQPTPYLRRIVEAVADGPTADQSDQLVEQLSERELEVLRYLPSRLSNAEIASRLFVSLNTLKTHLKAIYRKLGVSSRSEAVERAEKLDLA